MGDFICKTLLILLVACTIVEQNAAQDSGRHHQRLKVQFFHELAWHGRVQWKAVTILYSEETTDRGDSDWIFDLEIPKQFFDIDLHNSSSLGTMSRTDAYIVITSDENSEEFFVKSIKNLIASKQIDSTKTLVIFSRNIYISLIQQATADIDVILVEEKYSWDPNTKASDKAVLQFHRYRSLSALLPSGMGPSVYRGTENLTADQKRILFDRSFSYGNRQLKVTTFPLPPTTIECKENKDRFCGRDPNLIRVIGEMLHFHPVFSSPTPPDSKWGNRLANGSWTGLIGQVSLGQTTLGVANVFTSVPYMEQVEFSYPYDVSCSTFLTPSPSIWPQFYTLVKPFDVSLWMATLFSLLIGGILIQMVALLYHRLFGFKDRLQIFGEAMMYNAQSITGVRSGSENNSAWPIRLYNSNWWLFCFLLGTIYRTGLTSWLASSPILMSPIDTISQLVRSDLKPYGYNTFVRDVARDSNDADTIQLGHRLELVPPNVTAQFLMGQQDTNALYENKNYLKYLSATILPSSMQRNNMSVKNVEPRQRLHVMRECLRTFPVAIAMTPATPFKSDVTRIINRLNAAGIIQHWLDSGVYNDKILMKNLKKNKGHEPFSLYSLEGVFYLLLLCYIIDIAVFMIEVMFHYFFCRRNNIADIGAVVLNE